MTRAGLCLIGLGFSLNAAAHHSPNLHFDRGDVAEISGELVNVAWRNPHTELTVATLDENGREILWLIDARGATQFLRAGLGPEMFQVGDPIQVAGFRGRRNRNALFSTNILLADGRELVSENFAEPRWTVDRAVMTVSPDRDLSGVGGSIEAEGIFRVWGRDRSDHGIQGTGRSLWKETYPLTARAQAVQAGWDRVADNPYIRCETGMPAIMDLGTPMEFVLEGDVVVLYLEEQDTVRRIHMASAAAAPEEGSPLGHSVGHWDNEALVVTTSHIDWPWFDQSGVPQSGAVAFAERFTPSPDGSVLDYEITVTDPATFTEPVLLQRRWVWEPGEQRRPYNCIWERDDL